VLPRGPALGILLLLSDKADDLAYGRLPPRSSFAVLFIEIHTL
jgi:hypothetical protein